MKQDTNKRSGLAGLWCHGCWVLLLAIVVTGCAPDGALTKTPIAGLYAQVPDNFRKPVQKNELDLKVAEAKLELAEDRLALSKATHKLMGMELNHAAKTETYADYTFAYHKVLRQKALIQLEIAKSEAVNRAGLGEKAENIRTIGDLTGQKLSVESQAVRIKTEMDTLKLEVDALARQIDAQKEVVAELEIK